MAHISNFFFGLILFSALTGCALTSAGVKKGDERNFVRSLNDVSAGRVIEARMKRAFDYKLKGVDVEVAEGVVLLSGNVPSQQDRIEAARIAWSAPRIDQVGNEIKINSKQGFVRNTKDGVLEKSVRTRLTVDKYVKGRNFNVETHDGIVYLLGVARDQRELERAARIASTTRGTREVISYVRVANLTDGQNFNSRDRVPSGISQSANQSFTQPQPLQGFVDATPNPIAQTQIPAPVRNLPLSAPIPFTPPSASLGAQSAQGFSGITGGPTAPPQIDIGERLGKELPSNDELGAYRTGGAGQAVSVIESAPYYVDPETGQEIPVRFDANGNFVPLIIK